jgi:uridine nucleosidase
MHVAVKAVSWSLLKAPPASGAVLLLPRRLPNCWLVGLDVTHKCCMSAGAIEGMAGRGRHGTFLRDITQFYLGYHRWELNGVE